MSGVFKVVQSYTCDLIQAEASILGLAADSLAFAQLHFTLEHEQTAGSHRPRPGVFKSGQSLPSQQLPSWRPRTQRARKATSQGCRRRLCSWLLSKQRRKIFWSCDSSIETLTTRFSARSSRRTSPSKPSHRSERRARQQMLQTQDKYWRTRR